MAQHKQRMGDALDRMRILLETARKPEALAVLEGYGYPAARLDEGQAYHQAAEQAYLKAIKEHGEALGASQTLEAAIDQAYRIYMGHVRQARTAFRGNREALSKLGLLGPRKQDRAGWARQVLDFYAQIQRDSALLEVFVAHGIDLSEGLGALEEVQRLRVEQRRERGEARQARIERDSAFLEMEIWRKIFVDIARLAFRRAPGLLKQLNI